jgi:hypothetical protein
MRNGIFKADCSIRLGNNEWEFWLGLRACALGGAQEALPSLSAMMHAYLFAK